MLGAAGGGVLADEAEALTGSGLLLVVVAAPTVFPVVPPQPASAKTAIAAVVIFWGALDLIMVPRSE